MLLFQSKFEGSICSFLPFKLQAYFHYVLYFHAEIELKYI